jgi:hypothetical protein
LANNHHAAGIISSSSSSSSSSRSHAVSGGTTIHDIVFHTESLGIMLDMSAGIGFIVAGVTNEKYENTFYPGDVIFSIGIMELWDSIKKRDLKINIIIF